MAPRRVLESFDLGSLRLRNRVAFISTVCNIGRDHFFDEARIAFYVERARGGVGLIITEGMSVHPTSVPVPTVPFVHDESLVPNFRKLADAVHAEGAAIIGQLWHVGRNSLWSPFLTPWSASEERDPLSGTTPHAMTEDEIAELVAAYARSAVNLERAGFDGAELHGGHGYLITQFLSPWSNHRTDRWGGSVENRCRFVVEIVRAIRKAVGSGFVLGMKFSAHEYVEGGIDLEEGQRIIGHVMEHAPIDFIEVTQSNFSPSLERHTPDMRFDDMPFVHLAAGIRKVARGAPIMAVAKIPDLQSGERLIESETADLIGLSRPLLADPHLVNKTVAGRTPRPCIYCNVCWDVVHQLRPVACIYAPETGQEKEGITTVQRSHSPRRIRIIGAGPAGLEVARVCALAGHAVTVYEREREAGGRIARDARVPGRSTVGKAWRWMRDEATAAGAELRCGENVTAEQMRLWPAGDLVVQATGAEPIVEPLPGAVTISLEDAIMAGSALVGPIAIIDEIEDEPVYAVAEMLAVAGVDVCLVTRRQAIGRRTPYVNLIGTLRRLDELGVAMHTLLVPSRMEGGELMARHGLSGRERSLGPVRTIVRAGPYRATRRLQRDEGHVIVVGDAYSPRTVTAIVREANAIARKIETLQAR